MHSNINTIYTSFVSQLGDSKIIYTYGMYYMKSGYFRNGPRLRKTEQKLVQEYSLNGTR